jgi:hypothetical protein
MEEVSYYEITNYGWECPCGQFNEEQDDPMYLESVVCEECGKEFKPVQG